MRVLVILGAWLAASAALAQPAAKPADQNPDWLRKPSAEDLDAVWPAAGRDISGAAAIRCKVTPVGTLINCRVASETPAGKGFGQAALLLSPRFLMRPKIENGRPVEGDVTIPIRFTNKGIGEGTRINVALTVDWAEVPNLQDMEEAWPEGVPAEHGYGHVVIRCAFKVSGELFDCGRISEQPEGHGFYRAARKLLPRFRLDPEGREGGHTRNLFIDLPIHLERPGTPSTSGC